MRTAASTTTDLPEREGEGAVQACTDTRCILLPQYHHTPARESRAAAVDDVKMSRRMSFQLDNSATWWPVAPQEDSIVEVIRGTLASPARDPANV